MELKDRQFNDTEEKIKREKEELFCTPVIVSEDDMGKFEEQEMMKIRPIKKNENDQLIRQSVMGKKPIILRDKLKDKTDTSLIRGIRTLFEQEEDYYEPKRVSNFWNNNYIEYESNGDKNRDLSPDEYLSKIESYLRNIIINLQNSDAWKIQLTIAINFISSKDVEEEHEMRSRSSNIKCTFYNDVNEVVDERFDSLSSRYQGNLQTPMRGSGFIFDSVQLMYCKCHKVTFRDGCS